MKSTDETSESATWVDRLDRLMAAVQRSSPEDAGYASANRDCVAQTLRGAGPDSPPKDSEPAAGARMVVNIPAAHVPDFCAASLRKDPKPYLNTYDLAPPGSSVLGKRRQVDDALPLPAGQEAKNTYFGAVELNGCGVRFYGDVTLVLRPAAIDASTVILDRNSYDVIRAPASQRISARPDREQQQERCRLLASWSGEWGRDLAAMAMVMLMRALGTTARRWTTGQISQSLCNDEDYIEVLKKDSFGTGDLQEARIRAADAAHDALVASRMSRLPLPRLESMIWRHRRRRAEAALRAAGVPVRIVATEGRLKG